MKQKIKTIFDFILRPYLKIIHFELGLFTSFFFSNQNGLFSNIYSLQPFLNLSKY